MPRPFPVPELPAGVDERHVVTRQRPGGGEFERGVEAGPAVQVPVAASAHHPALRSPPHLLAGEQVSPLLGDPAAESRPCPEQGFVNQRDLVVVDDEQPTSASVATTSAVRHGSISVTSR